MGLQRRSGGCRGAMADGLGRCSHQRPVVLLQRSTVTRTAAAVTVTADPVTTTPEAVTVTPPAITIDPPRVTATAPAVTMTAAAGDEADDVEAAPAQDGSTLEALASLPVKGRAPKTGYGRDEFGSAWTDASTGAWVVRQLRHRTRHGLSSRVSCPVRTDRARACPHRAEGVPATGAGHPGPADARRPGRVAGARPRVVYSPHIEPRRTQGGLLTGGIGVAIRPHPLPERKATARTLVAAGES